MCILNQNDIAGGMAVKPVRPYFYLPGFHSLHHLYAAKWVFKAKKCFIPPPYLHWKMWVALGTTRTSQYKAFPEGQPCNFSHKTAIPTKCVLLISRLRW